MYFADVAYCAGKAAFDKMHHDMGSSSGSRRAELYPQAGIPRTPTSPAVTRPPTRVARSPR